MSGQLQVRENGDHIGPPPSAAVVVVVDGVAPPRQLADAKPRMAIALPQTLIGAWIDDENWLPVKNAGVQKETCFACAGALNASRPAPAIAAPPTRRRICRFTVLPFPVSVRRRSVSPRPSRIAKPNERSFDAVSRVI